MTWYILYEKLSLNKNYKKVFKQFLLKFYIANSVVTGQKFECLLLYFYNISAPNLHICSCLIFMRIQQIHRVPVYCIICTRIIVQNSVIYYSIHWMKRVLQFEIQLKGWKIYRLCNPNLQHPSFGTCSIFYPSN